MRTKAQQDYFLCAPSRAFASTCSVICVQDLTLARLQLVQNLRSMYGLNEREIGRQV